MKPVHISRIAWAVFMCIMLLDMQEDIPNRAALMVMATFFAIVAEYLYHKSQE